MGLDILSPSGDYIDSSRQYERISTEKEIDRKLPHLTLDPRVDIGAGAEMLSNGMTETMKPSDTKDFIKILKSFLPKDLESQVESITKEDIAKMAALILGATLLIASGVGIIPAITTIGIRLGIQTALLRIGVFIVSRPSSTSAIMGLIPGMKSLAPNQSIAFGVSELRNMILYILPGVASKAFTDLQTQKNN